MSSQEIAPQYAAPRKRKLVLLIILAILGAYYFIQKTSNFPGISSAPQQHEPAARAKAVTPAPTLAALAFDAVSADDYGMLIIAGRGPAGSQIVLKNGAETIGETQADENGEWVLMPEKPLPAGDYLFTLEAKDAGGTVVQGKKTLSFTVTPRTHALPRPSIASATPPAENNTGSGQQRNTVAIRHGDTLWGLALRHFGNAMRYREIAAVNKDQIKNPDLIFPQQQVEIPQK